MDRSDPAALSTFWAQTLGPGAVDGTMTAEAPLPRTPSGGLTPLGRERGALPLATVRKSQPSHGTTPADDTEALAPGGSFAIVQELGRGGMGIVYRARQGSLDREIALKTLKPEAATEAARDRFVAEARVTGHLDHPNIVPVHELGCTAAGEVFLAMKWMRGKAWSTLLKPKSDDERAAGVEFTLERHLDVLVQVCRALEFAHSKGIVHRDLKPENVMVGGFGEVLVMDWGIAVDVRRRFSTTIEGDHAFYARYATWLTQHGDLRTAAETARRAQQATKTGAAFFLPAWVPAMLDLALWCVAWLTPVLALLALALWRRARRTRLVDLHALGFRTRKDRVLAFFTHPWLRLLHAFPAYATRPARLTMALLGLAVLAALGVSAATTSAIMELASVGSHVGNGFAGEDGMRRDLERTLADHGDAGPVLRLLGESYHARRDFGRAKDVLTRAVELDPTDAVARHNLALIHAMPPGNRALLPEWRRCAATDLSAALVHTLSHAGRVATAVAAGIRGEGMDVVHSIVQAVGHPGTSEVMALMAAAIGTDLALAMQVAGLAWLCLPVRPLLPAPVAPTVPAVLGQAKWRRRIGWPWRTVRVVVPGLDDVLGDRPALGIAWLAPFVVALGAAGALAGQGAVATATTVQFVDLFPSVPPMVVEPRMELAARVALAVCGALLAANLGRFAWRWRTRRASSAHASA